ncbi:SNF2 helicase associated domain-containing protein [Paenibacillus sp. SI8]|uniref:DEAD/DEAH box helicase n=1 Tax=unclassified Paenibacillus TaxID=185978 RepID=UPI003466649C
MSFQLTDQVIRSLCGLFAYEKGEDFYQEGRVTFTNEDSGRDEYEAIVKEESMHEVRVEFDSHDEIDARCTCPAYFPDDFYCAHIAAVLLHIQDFQAASSPSMRDSRELANNNEAVTSAGDSLMTSGLLALFGEKTLLSTQTRALFDAREVLDVEFTCKPFSFHRKIMFGIEIKVGSKRLYMAHKIREFLDHIDRKKAYVFSKNFIYDPNHHSFGKENDAILRQLIQIYRQEEIYRDSGNSLNRLGGERMILIPPLFGEKLLPLLVDAPLGKIEQDNRTINGIEWNEASIPLSFEFDQARTEGYQLEVLGLDEIIVMEAYGIVLSEGKLQKLPDQQCKRLAELKQMMEASRRHRIQIPHTQIEPFMEKVIPGLMKLGSVRIAQSVSDRMMQMPLKAKLYLDRVKDRLLAELEFQYGEILINPLEGSIQRRSGDRILVRDGEQERQILSLMEQGAFAKTEVGYFLDDEEAEYEFLHNIVPQLEKHLVVYATSAVKAKLYTGPIHPKVKVDVDERTDWLEFQFELSGIPESEIRRILKSLAEKRNFHKLPNGALMPLESAEFQEIVRVMNELGIGHRDVLAEKIRLPVIRGLQLMVAERQGNAVSLGKSLRRLLDNVRNPDHLEFPVPSSLESVLRDYQKYGFGWMKTLAHYRFGGILADDMGLGKTLQSIAFIVSMLPEIRERKLPAIIVSPASLVYNWRNEFKKFAPELLVVIADGTRVERTKILKHAANVDVIIASYPLLRRDIDLYVDSSFHTLILDEAQVFKNYATQTAQAVKVIRAQYRFALTGTPVENRLEELWSIFDAVFPALFPARKAFNELSRETVAKRIRPFLLRRLKTDVLKELPEKIESLQASELLPEQKKLYAAYLAELQQETLKHLNEQGFQKNRIKILAGLTRLRQLCCHPSLFVEDYTGSSAKFEQLLEIIEDCRSAGKRLLIFSQFTQMLALMERELSVQGVPYFYLDGQTPPAERVELCNRFNGGERDLFLLSLKAGGTGLNLTGADTVVLYDLWWNPAVEQQAADRAHRIGQQNVVQVIRLVTQGTVEDKMYELQQRKKNLIEEVIRPGEEALSTLSEQEIREILMIES